MHYINEYHSSNVIVFTLLLRIHIIYLIYCGIFAQGKNCEASRDSCYFANRHVSMATVGYNNNGK
jgi:hypothetical protein